MGVLETLGSVVEADDASGCELIGMVVYDFVCDLAEANRGEISKAFALWGLDRVQVAKRSLGRSYVERVSSGVYPDDEEFLRAGRWLAGIEQFVSKASESWSIDGRIVQRDVMRDAGGRFARSVGWNKGVRLENYQDDSRRAPRLKSNGRRDLLDDPDGLDDQTRVLYEQHQGNWELATNAALELRDAWSAAGQKADGVDVLLSITNADDSSSRQVRLPLDRVKSASGGGLNVDRGLAPDLGEYIVQVELVAARGRGGDDVARRLAEFNALASVGGPALASVAFADPELRQRLAGSLQMRSNPDQGALSRLFGVLDAGGRVLQGVTGMERLGEMAHLVGVMGPQAEQVLGPYVRRSAYRYRGTETTPSVELRRALEPAPGPEGNATRRDWAVVEAMADRRVDSSKVPADSPMLADALRWRAKGVDGDSLVMQVRADEAAGMLASTLPKDPFVSELSVASGQVLPSQGVIIDAKGRVVSQSVGFTDDHYLPFDLSNLGRLRGGQYVRTRQAGGLTGEDVYAAVMTGARHVQVVSPSGVFYLEFAPDFRGARGNSDKARSMYDRYLKILDAVDSSRLYLQDLDASTVRRLEVQAAQRFPRKDQDEQRAEFLDSLKQAERLKANQVDEDAVRRDALDSLRVARLPGEDDAAAVSRLRGADLRRFNDRFEELLEERYSERTNRLRLNGEGYEVALQTLQAQFPYFIRRVGREDLSSLPGGWGERAAGSKFRSDRGYVLPGSLRARSVKSGFRSRGPVLPVAHNPGWSQGEERKARAVDEAGGGSPAGGKEKAGQGRAAVPAGGAVSRPASSRLSQRVAGLVEDAANVTSALQVRDSLMPGDFDAAVKDALASSSEGDRARQAVFLFLAGNESQKSRMLDDPQAVDALGHALVKSGMFDAGARRWLESTSMPGDAAAEVLGADSVDDGVDLARGVVEQVVDASMLAGDFEMPMPEDAERDWAGLGNAKPLAFPEYSSLGSVSAARLVAEQDPVMASVASALATDLDTGELETLPRMAMRASVALEALSRLRTARADWEMRVGDAVASGGQVPSFSEFAPGRQAMSVYQDLFNDGEPLDDDQLEQADFEEQAETLQRAWDFAAVSRRLMFEGGGDVFPKAESRELLRPVWKALGGLLVLDPGDPWSVGVAKSLGVWRGR